MPVNLAAIGDPPAGRTPPVVVSASVAGLIVADPAPLKASTPKSRLRSLTTDKGGTICAVAVALPDAGAATAEPAPNSDAKRRNATDQDFMPLAVQG